jgi:tol-pal system protein YbgF
MTAITARTVTALATGLILLGGCTLGPRPSALPPREQGKDPGLAMDLEALKSENAALRKKQQDSDARIEAVQRQLAEEQERQRKFREMMKTNFDLLEQSVALTLSKGIESRNLMEEKSADPVHAAQASPPEPSPPKVVAAPAPRPAPAEQPRLTASAPASPLASPPLTTSPSAIARPSAPATSAGEAAPQAAALAATEAPLDDPDLKDPPNPHRLSAHPEAKPLYEKGFALFAGKDYDQAILVFRNFLNRFPNDNYSDNAQFWIGESFLRMNRPAEAEAAYRLVLRNYEHRSTLEGYKTPDAIYRIGQTFQMRNDPRRARYYFEAVKVKFADTTAGRKAQRDLESQVENTAAN